MTPTRELAAQILEELNAVAVHTPVTAAAIFGGVGMAPQEHAFRSGVDVLVATPGRLLDLVNQRAVVLSAAGIHLSGPFAAQPFVDPPFATFLQFRPVLAST